MPAHSAPHEITIKIGVDYTADLKRRLDKYGISQRRLAKEMKMSPTQVSRWFNSPMNPRWSSIQSIEKAILSILRQRERDGRI